MRARMTSFLVGAGLLASWLGCGSKASTPPFDTAADGGGSDAAHAGDAHAGSGSGGSSGSSGSSGGSGSGSGSGGGSGGSSGGVACTPSCGGKQCGGDGCGGTCGTCASGQLCGASGTCAASTGGTALEVDAQSGLTAISPAIYGVAFAEAKSLGVATVQRFGGDCSSMYNWKVDAFNCGADYIYANQPLVGFGYPPYDATDIPKGMTGTDWLVTFDKQNSVDTLMTVPMIGWVAKDGASTGDQSGSDPAQDAVQTTAMSTTQWIQHLVSTFGGANAGGVKYYQLDNEVDNWVGMHPDVHPKAAGSMEILQSIETYGGAIKAADPNATVLVYSPANVSALLYSPVDFASLGSDRPFVPPAFDAATNNFSTWLLAQAAAYEKSNGVRVIDCLDMHYPSAGSNPVEDVRSLWDPTYDENSWETQDAYGGPLDLLPRMQAWINANYPGTGICISEYQYYPPGASGSAADPKSGVTEADALGIFGKYGVKLATYWTTLVADNGDISPTFNAFAMYRNYDGAGGHFGGTSVGATTTMTDVTVYGAVDSPAAPTTLWVMVINKTTSTQSNIGLKIDHFTPTMTSAGMYQSVGTATPKAVSSVPISGGQLTLTLPALSINMLVIK